MKKLFSCCALIVALVAFTTPAHAQSGYGASVAVGDGEVFVGEAGNVISSGFVYVYRPTANGWKEVAKLSASDGDDRDRFGRSMFVDGDLLLIGGLNTALSLFYYLRVVKVMTLDDPPDPLPLPLPLGQSGGGRFILLLTVPTALLILAWEPLSTCATPAALFLIQHVPL